MSRIQKPSPRIAAETRENLTKPLRLDDQFQTRSPRTDRQAIGRIKPMPKPLAIDSERVRGGHGGKKPLPCDAYAQKPRPPVDLLGGLQNLVGRSMNEWFGAPRAEVLPQPAPIATDPAQGELIARVGDQLGSIGGGISGIGPGEPAAPPEAPMQLANSGTYSFDV